MSYVRFSRGYSDVYVFETTVGGNDMLCCCGCFLEKVTGQESYVCATADEMVFHLRCHQEVGDLVPEHVIPNVTERTEMQFIMGERAKLEPTP